MSAPTQESRASARQIIRTVQGIADRLKFHRLWTLGLLKSGKLDVCHRTDGRWWAYADDLDAWRLANPRGNRGRPYREPKPSAASAPFCRVQIRDWTTDFHIDSAQITLPFKRTERIIKLCGGKHLAAFVALAMSADGEGIVDLSKMPKHYRDLAPDSSVRKLLWAFELRPIDA